MDGDWLDAGDYSLAISTKYAKLTRIRKPGACLPGAIDYADSVQISREDWDAGRRRVYPYREGVPLVFLAPGAKDWGPKDDRITAEDIKAMF